MWKVGHSVEENHMSGFICVSHSLTSEGLNKEDQKHRKWFTFSKAKPKLSGLRNPLVWVENANHPQNMLQTHMNMTTFTSYIIFSFLSLFIESSFFHLLFLFFDMKRKKRCASDYEPKLLLFALFWCCCCSRCSSSCFTLLWILSLSSVSIIFP